MSMRRYSVTGASDGTAPGTAVGITATTAVKPAIYDVIVGSAGTPADAAAIIALQRYTGTGTHTDFPPIALDPDQTAAVGIGDVNHSGEPTYTTGAELLQIALNQRATFRWVAAPGSELVCPATANNGIGVQIVSGPSVVYDATVLFVE